MAAGGVIEKHISGTITLERTTAGDMKGAVVAHQTGIGTHRLALAVDCTAAWSVRTLRCDNSDPRYSLCVEYGIVAVGSNEVDHLENVFLEVPKNFREQRLADPVSGHHCEGAGRSGQQKADVEHSTDRGLCHIYPAAG